MTATSKATLTVFGGDVLEVVWTGSVWQSPTHGSQHAHARDAMRVELESFIRDCGDDPRDLDVERMLRRIVVS
jgi:hypothetical protein